MTRYLALALSCSLCLVVVASTGCGGGTKGSGTINGKITYKGQVVNRPKVELHPSAGGGQTYPVPVGQDGTFRLTDVPLGQFKVTVVGSPAEPGMDKMPGFDPAKAQGMSEAMIKGSPATIAIPAKYANTATTDLNVTIDRSTKTLDLELKD